MLDLFNDRTVEFARNELIRTNDGNKGHVRGNVETSGLQATY